jgi:hypothetical protein
LIPEDSGKFKPWGMLTTDQNKYMSLYQVEQIFHRVCKEYDLPKGTVLVNGDKHGAGGICTTVE